MYNCKHFWNTLNIHIPSSTNTRYWLQNFKIIPPPLPHTLLQWDFLLPFVLRHFWINRNHNVFNNSPKEIPSNQITARVLEFMYSTNSTSIYVKWFAPTADGLKLNMNGSYNPTTSVQGIGGVFRDNSGNWIRVFL